MPIPRRVLLASAAMLPPAARARAACDRFEDLMPSFWAAYDRGQGLAPEPRARLLIEHYFTPNIAAYRDAGVGRVDLARWLTPFDPMADAVRALSARLPALWCSRLEAFRRALPDAAATVPAVAMISFLNFDGRVRPRDGAVALFLGLDMIQWLHGDAVGAFFDHERFHLYHHEVNASLILPGGDPLWLGIWKEGLAVHATQVLNPGASRREVFLGDETLAAMGPDLFRRLAAELPDRLGATDGTIRARYLSFGYRGDIPARSGYALGAAIVERAAAGRDLAALARIPAAEAEAIMRREIAALAR